jgi:NitT/TauT family transport system permease protein
MGLHPSRSSLVHRAVRTAVLGAVLVVSWLILIVLGVAIFTTYTSPIPPAALSYIHLVPLALLYSSSRVFTAYLIALAISFPLALYLYRHPRATRLGMPVIQVIASIPATALFPLFLFSLKGYLGTEPAVIFVILTGTIWYLFFNIYSGLRSIPPDLEEAARSLDLKGKPYFRRLVFPGTYAAFITGSITAMGAAWNTLVIAEYLSYGGKSISVLGLGQLIDIGVFSPPSGIDSLALMATALLTLTITVVVVNKLIWRPLYRIATEKYRYD